MRDVFPGHIFAGYIFLILSRYCEGKFHQTHKVSDNRKNQFRNFFLEILHSLWIQNNGENVLRNKSYILTATSDAILLLQPCTNDDL